MTVRRPRLLVVGSFVMDLIVSVQKLPNSGETRLGQTFSTAPGGKGANQAIQAARLGASVSLVGRVGDDEFGRRLVASAREAGVSVEHVAVDSTQASAIGNVLLEMEEGGGSRNRIVVVPGANMAIQPADVDFLVEEIGGYDMVLLQNEIPLEVNLRVAEYAEMAGVPVMLNPAPAADIPQILLEKLDYLAPNEHELEAMTGVRVKMDHRIDRPALERAIRQLHERGVRNVVVTLGNGGAAVSDGKEIFYSPCIDVVRPVDPTAAGDSFIGGFAMAVCLGLSKREALEFANYTATLTVSRMGAQPSLPDLREVLELLDCEGDTFVGREKLRQMLCSGNAGVIQTRTQEALERFKSISRPEVDACIDAIRSTDYESAARLIWKAQANGGRVHVTGIGKPAHIAGYMASLLSSTGTPAYFLHGTEAVHGSCGQLMPNDVVICISNSGETEEMKATVRAIRNNGCSVIGVTGNSESWLAKQSDAHLFAGVEQEGGPLNRAPRSSILAETLVLQGLSIVLQAQRGITAHEYVRWHPGGTLGTLRADEMKDGV